MGGGGGGGVNYGGAVNPTKTHSKCREIIPVQLMLNE